MIIPRVKETKEAKETKETKEAKEAKAANLTYKNIAKECEQFKIWKDSCSHKKLGAARFIQVKNKAYSDSSLRRWAKLLQEVEALEGVTHAQLDEEFVDTTSHSLRLWWKGQEIVAKSEGEGE